MGIAKNSLFLFLMQGVTLVSGVILSIVVSRYLGPTQRGVYFLVLAANGFLVSMGTLGMTYACNFIMAKRKHPLNEVHSIALFSAVGIGFFVILLYSLFQQPLQNSIFKGLSSYYIWIGIGLVPLTLYESFWTGIMTGMNRFKIISFIGIARSILGLVFTLFVICLMDLGIRGLMGLWILMVLFFTGVRIYLIHQEEKFRFKFSIKLFKEVVSLGLRGHLSDIAFFIYSQAHIFIVNFLLGPLSVGYYSLSTSLSGKIGFFVSPIIRAANPIIGRSEKKEAEKVTASVSRHVLFISFLVILGIGFSSPWALPFAYGKAYLPALKPLLILLPGILFFSTSIVYSFYFSYQLGKPQIPAVYSWITLVVNVPCCFFLTSHWGIIGAGMAMTISYSMIFFMSLLWFKQKSQIPLQDILIIKKSDFNVYRDWINKLWERVKEIFSNLRPVTVDVGDEI